MSACTLLAIAPGPFSTIQDPGRVGWRRYGVTSAGAMDLESHAVANALVGNPVAAATVEFAHGGGEWSITDGSARIAVAGGAFAAAIDGKPIPPLTSAVLREGQKLRIGGAKDAVWGYLAVSGGIQVPLELGSRATHPRVAMGGLAGRHLTAGDALPLRIEKLQDGDRTLNRPGRDLHDPVRVLLGPQDDYFTPEAIDTFLSATFVVAWQTDRMGYRLDGPPLQHAKGFNIVSDAILPGSIQVPGSQCPIVLLRDAQTTGGYPKIATILSSDLGRFAQLRPMSKVRFRSVDPEDAQLLRREFISRVHATGLHVQRV